ncbi:MAG TPA: DNA replication/repair protein RecF [Hellea balneolensis]|uniref:DNA replication and repair protein RecF n=1 Tax=Hellea balneolensis TaxID=287478 RepID=A0A7C5LSB3_9PROT|nr:DNA replication/repair protein RecF [Hellea balneolensis]
MVYFKTLKLENYRSYSQLDVRFDGRPVVLFGANGSGKTNLLEAISLFSPGRGLRRAKTENLTRRAGEAPAPQWAVFADIDGLDIEKIGTGSVPGSPSRRLVRIDEGPASALDLARAFSVGWLTPAQDRLFGAPASERRKFLDRLCLAHQPDHGKTWLIYEKARSERGRLFTEGIDDPYWFDALEADMAKRGAQIAVARHQCVQKLVDEIDARPDGPFPKSDLMLQGEAESLAAAGADEYEISEFIKTELKKDRALDARAGRTLRGVHKTDLFVAHREKSMPAHDCSTGEQKALLTGLVLAHARAQARRPFLLLDEVAAHLDAARRDSLVEEILDLGTQCFLTGTDRSLFDGFAGRAQIFHVHKGQLVEKH